MNCIVEVIIKNKSLLPNRLYTSAINYNYIKMFYWMLWNHHSNLNIQIKHKFKGIPINTNVQIEIDTYYNLVVNKFGNSTNTTE